MVTKPAHTQMSQHSGTKAAVAQRHTNKHHAKTRPTHILSPWQFPHFYCADRHIATGRRFCFHMAILAPWLLQAPSNGHPVLLNFPGPNLHPQQSTAPAGRSRRETPNLFFLSLSSCLIIRSHPTTSDTSDHFRYIELHRRRIGIACQPCESTHHACGSKHAALNLPQHTAYTARKTESTRH